MSSFYEDNNPTPWEEEDGLSKLKNLKIRLPSQDKEFKRSTERQKNKKPSGNVTSTVIFVVILIFLVTIALSLGVGGDVTPENVPQIVDIEQLDNYPISNKEIKYAVMLVNYYDKLETDFSNIPYKYKVTLDNGREFIMHPGDTVEKIGVPGLYLELNGYIWCNDFGEVIKNTDTTADINVSAKIKDDSSKYDTVLQETKVAFEKEIVEQYVLSITSVSEEPVIIYENFDECYMDGGEFEITYYDGRKIIAKPEMSEDGRYQTIDGHRFDLYTDTDLNKAFLTFLDDDNGCNITYTEMPCSFSEIEITDCKFNESYEITSVSYTVTEEDGTVTKYENIVPYYDYFGVCYLGTVKGYKVSVDCRFVYPDEQIGVDSDYEFGENAAIGVDLSLDYIISDEFYCDPPESDCECICHNNEAKTKKAYETIQSFTEAFGIFKYCECGIQHHDILIYY